MSAYSIHPTYGSLIHASRNTITRQGWLLKLGGTRMSKKWQSRYFVLTKKYLYYFSSNRESEPTIGVICIDNQIQLKLLSAPKSPTKNLPCIRFSDQGRSTRINEAKKFQRKSEYFLSFAVAETENNRITLITNVLQEWLKSINDLIAGRKPNGPFLGLLRDNSGELTKQVDSNPQISTRTRASTVSVMTGFTNVSNPEAEKSHLPIMPLSVSSNPSSLSTSYPTSHSSIFNSSRNYDLYVPPHTSPPPKSRFNLDPMQFSTLSLRKANIQIASFVSQCKNKLIDIEKNIALDVKMENQSIEDKSQTAEVSTMNNSTDSNPSATKSPTEYETPLNHCKSPCCITNQQNLHFLIKSLSEIVSIQQNEISQLRSEISKIRSFIGQSNSKSSNKDQEHPNDMDRRWSLATNDNDFSDW